MPESAFAELAAGLLREGYAVRFRATGGSMHPSIRHGQRVKAVPARFCEIRRGDVVVYTWQRGILAHRVVEIESHALIARGDAGGARERVHAAQVIGKLAGAVRRRRPLRQWLGALLGRKNETRLAQSGEVFDHIALDLGGRSMEAEGQFGRNFGSGPAPVQQFPDGAADLVQSEDRIQVAHTSRNRHDHGFSGHQSCHKPGGFPEDLVFFSHPDHGSRQRLT